MSMTSQLSHHSPRHGMNENGSQSSRLSHDRWIGGEEVPQDKQEIIQTIEPVEETRDTPDAEAITEQRPLRRPSANASSEDFDRLVREITIVDEPQKKAPPAKRPPRRPRARLSRVDKKMAKAFGSLSLTVPSHRKLKQNLKHVKTDTVTQSENRIKGEIQAKQVEGTENVSGDRTQNEQEEKVKDTNGVTKQRTPVEGRVDEKEENLEVVELIDKSPETYTGSKEQSKPILGSQNYIHKPRPSNTLKVIKPRKAKSKERRPKQSKGQKVKKPMVVKPPPAVDSDKDIDTTILTEDHNTTINKRSETKLMDDDLEKAPIVKPSSAGSEEMATTRPERVTRSAEATTTQSREKATKPIKVKRRIAFGNKPLKEGRQAKKEATVITKLKQEVKVWLSALYFKLSFTEEDKS